MAELIPHRRVHIVGIGGAGMSALAKLLSGRGHAVTGSDLRSSESLAVLADLGMDVWSGHDPGRIDTPDLVVASSAVRDGDPELKRASSLGVPVWRRPRLLAAITDALPTIGATGTHGKTTTTAMLVTALRACGFDPSFVIGGDSVDLGTNAHAGEDLLVLEVDEAFGTFEHVRVQGLIVTNVEAEHLDHFGSIDALEDAFANVARGVSGPVVACVDDPGARRLKERAGAIGYGVADGARWQIGRLVQSAGAVRFDLTGPGGVRPVSVPRPGVHVARNAAGVLALLGELGHDVQRAAAGLSGFHGVRRRYEVRGTVAGVTVIDDYAHHPTEVAVTVATALGEGRRVWAVFQPHLYSRTERLAGEFGAALARADRVVVTDVYGAREDPRPGVTGKLVAEAAERAGATVDYIPGRSDLAPFLAGATAAGDLVLTMGAGDITVTPTELLSLLAVRGDDV